MNFNEGLDSVDGDGASDARLESRSDHWSCLRWNLLTRLEETAGYDLSTIGSRGCSRFLVLSIPV